MQKNTKFLLFGSVLLFISLFSFTSLVRAEDAGVDTSTTESIQLVKPAVLPGSPLYFFKRLGEGIVNLLTFGKANQAKRALDLSQTRLAEGQALLEKNKIDLSQKSNEEYQTMISEASRLAQKAQEEGKNVDSILTQISQETLENQQVLLNVIEKAPEKAKLGLQNAIKASAKERQQVLQRLSEPKRQEVEAQDFDRNQEVQNKIEDLNLDISEEDLNALEDLNTDNDLNQIENEINKLQSNQEYTCKQSSDCGKSLICGDGKEYPAWSCNDGKCSQILYGRYPCATIPSPELEKE